MYSYHISDLKKFQKCERLYYLSENEQLNRLSYLRSIESPMDLIKEKYGLLDSGTYFEGNVGDDPSLVLNSLDKYDWFINARFEYNGLRFKAPILYKKQNGKFILYFINLTLYPKEDDIFSLACAYYILIKNGLDISEVKIIHMNDKYIRRNKLNPKSLFKETKYFYNHNNNLSKKLIKKSIENFECDYDAIVQKMNNHTIEDFEVLKKSVCTRHVKCPMYDKCFKEYEIYQHNSVLTLNSCKNKQIMFDNGVKYLKDADPKLIEGTKLQYAQIMADRNGGVFADCIPLKEFIKKLEQRPISFIDFEWDTYLIPPYKGMKPYGVLCFQYSCHILEKDGTLTHKEFLDINDSREEFIKHLLSDVAKEGPIVAYNAIGAETVRLKELAEMFPKYKEELDAINERFYDLAYPFINGLVYDTKMNGNYSLKSILKAVSDYSYDNLEIGQARLAVEAHRALEDGVGDSDEIRKELFEYCGLDTYSMVVVYNWLKDIIKK